MTYRQLSPAERYMLAALRRQGLNKSQIARALGRHRSTICREVRRNSSRADGCVAGITLRRDESLRSFQSGSDSEQAGDELRLSPRIASG